MSSSQVFKLDSPTVDADDAIDDDDDESELQSWAGKAQLLRLLEMCKLQSKSEMVKFVLCQGAFDGQGKDKCINCNCSKCGMDKLWSGKDGLRRHVVDEKGNIRADAPLGFSSQIKWMRILTSQKAVPGASNHQTKQANYETRVGTVVEFLDEFEKDVMRKFPHHRFTIARQKATAAQFDRNRGPGVVQSDVDFAMDGDIPPPEGRSIQSQARP